MSQGDQSKDLFSRFRPWFAGQHDKRRTFFTDGLVVLDANILLNLYRIRPSARDDVLSVLQRFADESRLWVPHQAALEFVRNREPTVVGRFDNIARTRRDVTAKFEAAVLAVVRARDQVKNVVWDFERDPAAKQDVEDSVQEADIRRALKPWRDDLEARLGALRDEHDIDPASFRRSDSLLDRINTLLADRIGDALPPGEAPELVRHFVEYRSPNLIPPGFADSTTKGTSAQDAGDYLLWEEVVRHAKENPPSSRLILLVTDDQKNDWCDRNGMALPELADELRQRADVLLRLEGMDDFLQGTKDFLGIAVSAATYTEVAEAAAAEADAETLPVEETSPDERAEHEPASLPEVVDATNAPSIDPSRFLRGAVAASGLLTPAGKDAAAQDRRFAWWLVGVTVALEMRRAEASEPAVHIQPADFGDEPPEPGWERERLRVNEGLHYVWVAPWLARLFGSLPAPDPTMLRRLAGRALTLQLTTAPDTADNAAGVAD
ncbi:MAG: PIN-like domain-containing protein [Sciscionella sp.]